jgi:H+/Cl- antiporter ClcA
VNPAPARRRLLIAAICGLCVALIGLFAHGETFGTGYEQARQAIEGQPLLPFLFAGKLAATFLSTISGIPGGLFASSLSVGAGLGSSIGLLLGASISLAALLGMAGYFAGVVQAPMTTFVILLEMTGPHDTVIPLMIASMLGYGTARIISNEPLHHALSRLFIADAVRRKRAGDLARHGVAG